MAGRLAGIAYIKADGSQFAVKGNVEAPISKTKREAVMGLGGVLGYKEVAQKPYVKFEAGFTADFDINKITTSVNMTITVEFANGQVYTLTGGFLEGDDIAANGDEGTVPLQFAGLDGNWQK